MDFTKISDKNSIFSPDSIVLPFAKEFIDLEWDVFSTKSGAEAVRFMKEVLGVGSGLGQALVLVVLGRLQRTISGF